MVIVHIVHRIMAIVMEDGIMGMIIPMGVSQVVTAEAVEWTKKRQNYDIFDTKLAKNTKK